ncbi:MAG: dCTP deaminase [Candidatus Paceibacterota bacterium]
MAVLSDKDIRKRIESNSIEFEPSPNLKEQLGPASLDLKLGEKVRELANRFKGPINPRDKNTIEGSTELTEIRKFFFLQKDDVILAETQELIRMPNDLCANVEGRSSLGRLFLGIHSTAGFVDPGFEGRITLELKNDGNRPVILFPGMRICQIIFKTMNSEPEVSYGDKSNSKYQNDKGPAESKIYKDFEEN